MNPKPPTDSPAARLNIFALPSRTTILFALIVLVIALPLAASLGGGSPICAPFVLFWMILLPIRDFLRRPAHLLRERAMADASARFPTLSRRWADLAASVAQIKAPRLLVTPRADTGIFTFGTFTRRYAVMSETTAAVLERSLQSPQEEERCRSEAVLLHELAHFRHRDVWMALFSHSLLRVTIGFMALNLIFYAMTPWLYNSLITFFDFGKLWPPEFIDAMNALDPQKVEVMLHPPQIVPALWERYEVFVLAAHWPLILGSLVLLAFYWRALLRTRELYADARVVQWQRSEGFLWNELLREQAAQAIQPWRGRGFRERVASLTARLRGANVLGLKGLREWLSTHPSLRTRRGCLDEPYKIYGSDVAIGMTAGVTVALLNLTLGSLFLSRFIRGPNSGVPFIIGFSVLSLSLLPFLCQFPERKREYSSKVTRVVLIFTAIKLIPQYLAGGMFAALLLTNPQWIDEVPYVLVPGAGPNPPPLGIPLDFVLEVFVIRPALLFTFVMPIVLILLLRFDAHVKRRMLRWYSAPFFMRRPGWALWGVTAFLVVPLGLVLLPILDALTIPTAHDLLDPPTLGGMFLGLGTTVAAVVAFLVWHRRYADRCPQCGTHVEGEYRLGNTCPACGELFHPQLCTIPQPSRAL